MLIQLTFKRKVSLLYKQDTILKFAELVILILKSIRFKLHSFHKELDMT